MVYVDTHKKLDKYINNIKKIVVETELLKHSLNTLKSNKPNLEQKIKINNNKNKIENEIIKEFYPTKINLPNSKNNLPNYKINSKNILSNYKINSNNNSPNYKINSNNNSPNYKINSKNNLTYSDNGSFNNKNNSDNSLSNYYLNNDSENIMIKNMNNLMRELGRNDESGDLGNNENYVEVPKILVIFKKRGLI